LTGGKANRAKSKKLLVVAGCSVCLILSVYLVFNRLAGEHLRMLTRQHFTPEKGFSVESADVHNFKLRLKKVEVVNPPLNLQLILRDFTVRPAFFPVRPGPGLAFAFSGPGEITSGKTSQPLTVSGSITGNVKTGQLTIKETKIHLESLGLAEVTGNLEDWGKKNISLEATLKKVSLRKLAEFFQTQLPVEGLLDGKANLVISGEDKLQKIDFRFNLLSLHARDNQEMFQGKINGTYDLTVNKGELSGLIEKPGGGRLHFSGSIEGENFSFHFSSDGLKLEEILPLLPEEWKKKLNLSGSQGSLEMKDFVVYGAKKNSL